MFKKLVILAIGLVLAAGVSARADEITTNVTLQAPYAGPAAVPNVVNVNAGVGAGLSYTVAEKGINGGFGPGNNVYATGAILLGGYKVDGSSNNNLKGGNLVLTYSLQGQQVPPVGGAALTANFNKGVFAVYDIGANSLNTVNPATWTNGKLVYSSSLVSPTNVTQGAGGDPGFAGQPLAGQNQASFFPASGVGSIGALLSHTNGNAANLLNQLFAPPQPFSGFQSEIQELNALATINYANLGGPGVPGPSNAALDANFLKVAGLDPSVLFNTLTPFTTNNYNPQSGANAGLNGDTVQSIGITNYPVFPNATPGVPEPASMLLWGLGAVGIGAWVRRRRAMKAA